MKIKIRCYWNHNNYFEGESEIIPDQPAKEWTQCHDNVNFATFINIKTGMIIGFNKIKKTGDIWSVNSTESCEIDADRVPAFAALVGYQEEK